MRTLIISDVHANITALKAVLQDAEPFDCVWCLGDVVGYGPDPNECIELIKSLPALKCIKGNHDAAILGDIDITTFNYEARASLEWLQTELVENNYNWLATLEIRLVVDNITLVHGSPRNPVWEYIMDLGSARENMTEFETKICLIGHTHLPCVYHMNDDSPKSTKLSIEPPNESFIINHKSIINPGSVGQPRDHDARASYMIYNDETESWFYHRVAYDFKSVQERILALGLPHRHALRLEGGW